MLQRMTPEVEKTVAKILVDQGRHVTLGFVDGDCIPLMGVVTPDEILEAYSTLGRFLGLSRQRIRNAEMAATAS